MADQRRLVAQAIITALIANGYRAHLITADTQVWGDWAKVWLTHIEVDVEYIGYKDSPLDSEIYQVELDLHLCVSRSCNLTDKFRLV